MKNVLGFTHIDLLSTMVIMGVLSASAVPKIINIKEQAETAAFEALGGVLLRAADLAHAKQIVANLGPNESIIHNGKVIKMSNGYPTEDSIGLLVNLAGFSWQPSNGWFVWEKANSQECRQDYNNAGSGENANSGYPQVVSTTRGC